MRKSKTSRRDFLKTFSIGAASIKLGLIKQKKLDDDLAADPKGQLESEYRNYVPDDGCLDLCSRLPCLGFFCRGLLLLTILVKRVYHVLSMLRPTWGPGHLVLCRRRREFLGPNHEGRWPFQGPCHDRY